MKKNTFKAALKAGQSQIGTWISLGDLFATRVMARVGLDYLTVDMEHYPTDWRQAASLFATISDAGGIPLARVPEGRHDYIKRALDAGAYGVICPMIESVEHAKHCIAAAKYPPTGNRSVGGALHALSFGASAGNYYQQADNEIAVILQTESPKGVDLAEEIYSLPGVDAIFVGPNDLKAQMRTPDGKDPSPEEFEAMLRRIVAAGKKCGVPVGLHVVNTEEAKRRSGEGWQFFAIGSELSMLIAQAQRVVSEMNLSPNQKDLARY